MNIKNNIYAFVFLLVFPLILKSQDNYQLGTLPTVNINKSLKNDWSLNLSWQSRQIFRDGEIGESSINKINYELNDFTLIASKKLGYNNLGGGYLIRFRDGNIVHRWLAQYVLIDKYEGFRMAYRFRADQTFFKNDETEVRFRFRIGTEIPLNGNSKDVGEYYLKLNNEYLNSWQSGAYDLEIRLIPVIGYVFSFKNKLEFGLDYRINSFIGGGNSDNNLWLNLNWYIKF